MDLIYSIQKHHAKRLHYDLRLEHNGVLKSWAIPKIPPCKAGLKRLAVQTENHSKRYAFFEGEIEEGYGKGTVKLWDRGTHKPEEMGRNKIVTKINGKKLKGYYVLIRLKAGKNWLFFKKKK